MPTAAPKLPNFFIVGAPKAGTTSLYHYLDQHPQIYMSAIKEPHYFAPEVHPANCEPEFARAILKGRPELQRFLAGPMVAKRHDGIIERWEDYPRLFANAGEARAMGEGSVCYLWSPSAASRIAEKIPQARIIILLRDPAERAYSQYLQGAGAGLIRWSLREHIDRSLKAERASGGAPAKIGVYHPFLSLGLYHDQVRRYQEQFGDRVWIGLQEEFRRDAAGFLRQVFTFLNVDPSFVPKTKERHLQRAGVHSPLVGWLKQAGVWRAAAKLMPRSLRPKIRRSLTKLEPMSAEDRRWLVDYYREEVGKLAGLIGRDLSGWLT
jgi:hypothetical protein